MNLGLSKYITFVRRSVFSTISDDVSEDEQSEDERENGSHIPAGKSQP